GVRRDGKEAQNIIIESKAKHAMMIEFLDARRRVHQHWLSGLKAGEDARTTRAEPFGESINEAIDFFEQRENFLGALDIPRHDNVAPQFQQIELTIKILLDRIQPRNKSAHEDDEDIETHALHFRRDRQHEVGLLFGIDRTEMTDDDLVVSARANLFRDLTRGEKTTSFDIWRYRNDRRRPAYHS